MNDGQEKVIFGLVIILIAIVLTLSALIVTIMKLGERVDDLEQKINGEGFYSSSLYIKGGDETIEALRKDFAAALNIKMTIAITEDPELILDYNVPATGTRLGRYVLVKEEAVKDYSSLLFQDLYFDVYLGLAAVAETKVYYGSYELALLMDKGEVGQSYGLEGYPMFVLVDKNGKITWSTSGEVDASTLQAEIDKVL